MRSLKPPKAEKQTHSASKLAAPSKISSFNPDSNIQAATDKSKLAHPSSVSKLAQPNKTFKKFVRRDSAKKENPGSMNSSIRTVKSSEGLDLDQVEEVKQLPTEEIKEAILSAKPVDELIDMDKLDQTGEVVEKILYGTIEEKVDALIQFNKILTFNLHESEESLIKNAEFISRTFSDVLDGVFYRFRDNIPSKFIHYMVQVFKK